MKKNSDDNANKLINIDYLIGINNKKKDRVINLEVKKLSEINKIKCLCLSSKDNNAIKNFLNDILIYLNKIEKLFKKQFKISLLSATSKGVGKLSLIKRIMNKPFDEFFPYYSKERYFLKTKNGKRLQLKFFKDTYKERVHSRVLNSLNSCDCVLLIYDITQRKSFEDLKVLCEDIFKKKYEKLKLIYLIENKIDRNLSREVGEEKAIDFAKKNNLRYFKISCYENLGIKEFLEDLGNELVKIRKIYYLEHDITDIAKKNIKKIENNKK